MVANPCKGFVNQESLIPSLITDFFITKYPMKIQQHTHFQRHTSINQTQIWYGEFNQ